MINRKHFLTLLSGSALLFSLVFFLAELALPLHASYAQQRNGGASNTNSSGSVSGGVATHQPDASPEVAVITIKSDASGHVVFEPNQVTIKVGEEILIVNNYTSAQSFTSGNGPTDPMMGTAFDTGLIQPKQFVEFTSANLQNGQQYPFFSKATPSANGTLIVSG